MLNFKPRLRSATQVSTWKPVPESKNRGAVTQNKIFTQGYQLNGYARNEGNANGIRLTTTIDWLVASVWWFNEFDYPVDMTVENYISGAADGLVTCIMNKSGSFGTIGGGGVDIGFPSGVTPPIAGIAQDQYNNGQPVPYYGFMDSRRGTGGQYPADFLTTPVADGWHTVRILWQANNFVTVWKDGVQILSSNWFTKTGYDLPVGPVIIGCTAATGTRNQNAFIRKLTVNGFVLYVAPGYS